jgi:outer membrane cobalamin receptor
LQGKIDNLLDEDYEEAFGFSTPGISIRGGITVNF